MAKYLILSRKRDLTAIMGRSNVALDNVGITMYRPPFTVSSKGRFPARLRGMLSIWSKGIH